MPTTDRRPNSMNLTALVLVGIAGTFVTALVLMTGEVLLLLPLYVVPIVIAALAYHVAGAVIVSALAAALLGFMSYSSSLDPAALPELGVGIAAFTVSGIVIGLQARRSRRHSEILEEASILDSLTGLYKRDYVDRRLAEELRRAERYGHSCSVILIEVDCFDAFKQQFGHYKADVLLEHLAEVVRISVRDHDIVGRHGAISFLCVLPMTGAADAGDVADRLRATVAETEFEGDVLEPATRCTIRTALATYPDDGGDRDCVLLAASRRLEAAS